MIQDEKEWIRIVTTKINQVRIDKGWSMLKLSDSANLDRGTLSEVLNQGNNTTLGTIHKLCKILEIEPKDLF